MKDPARDSVALVIRGSNYHMVVWSELRRMGLEFLATRGTVGFRAVLVCRQTRTP